MSSKRSGRHQGKAEQTPKFVRLTAVLQRYGISRSVWYDEVHRGRAPPPRKIGACSVWSVSELDQYDATLIAGVDQRRTAAANTGRRKAHATEVAS